MSIPKRHHFLPEFFLKRWCNDVDQKLFYFNRPHGPAVFSASKFPKEVGFEQFLYSLGNLPVEQAQEVEVDFFSKIDGKAALALDALDNKLHLSSDLEQHLWQFFVTLIARMPADLEKYFAYDDKISTDFLPSIARIAAASVFDLNQGDIQQSVDEVRQERKDTAIRALSALMSNENLLQHFHRFHWNVIDTSDTPHELLTSDRPAHFGREENALILMIPIAPRLLFAASNKRQAVDQIGRVNKNMLVKAVNKLTVGDASQCVFARTETQKPYISKHMGTTRSPSFMDQLLESAQVEYGKMLQVMNE